MAKKPTLTDVSSGYTSNTTLNNNFTALRDAFDNTLSRDGSTPNQMEADLDMNSNDILNVNDLDVGGTLTLQGADLNDLLDGVGPGTVFNTTNRFDGDGVATDFTLTKNPVSRANTQVYINGVYQQKNTYTVSGTTLSFTEAPPVGTDNIEVNIQESTDAGTLTADSVSTSDGEDVQAKLDQAHYTSRTAFVSGINSGKKWADGDVVSDGTVSYLKSTGATVISDMPDWLPFGQKSWRHFGAAGPDIYVDPAGSDANTGLSASSPLQTIQAASDKLKEFEPLTESWEIHLAAGTYTAGGSFERILSNNRFVISGPDVSGHPNVPTAIVDLSNANANALLFTSVRVQVKDVMLKRGKSITGGGIIAQDGCDLVTTNVHCDDCTEGMRIAHNVRARIQGGIIENCLNGLWITGAVVYSVGSGATSLSDGPIIRNNTQAGCQIQSSCSGHIDFTTLTGNARGVDLVDAGLHLLGSSVTNNATSGLKASSGARFFVNQGFPSTFSGNGQDYEVENFATDSIVHLNALSQLMVSASLSPVTHTGTTAKTQVVTAYTIPAGYLIGTRKRFRVRIFGSKVGAAGGFVVGLDGGATQFQTIGSGTSAASPWAAEFDVWSNGSSSQQVTCSLHQHNVANRVQPVQSSSVDMTVDVPVSITVEMFDAADTIKVDGYEVWLVG